MESFKSLSIERQKEIERILFNALVEIEKFKVKGRHTLHGEVKNKSIIPAELKNKRIQLLRPKTYNKSVKQEQISNIYYNETSR